MLANFHSYYSLRYGTLSITNIIELSKRYGYAQVGLTDIHNSTGVPEFVKTCKKAKLKPIVGIEFRIEDRIVFTGIAQTNIGLENLNRYLSQINLKKTKLTKEAPQLDDVVFIYPFLKTNYTLKENEYFGVKISELNKYHTSNLKNKKLKSILFNTFSFSNQTSHLLHKHMRAIDVNTLLSKLKPSDYAGKDELFLPHEKIKESSCNFPELINNAEKLFDNCNIDFDFGVNKNKAVYTNSEIDDFRLLEKLAHDGFAYRYTKSNQRALERIRKELKIIHKLGFCSYFLIGWDIVNFSMQKGFYHVGRGSGTNSIVAYCLKITDVDPIELDLYFERFINPKRTSPPDFDIDYSWKEREIVQDYIFSRFGQEHTALLGSMSTFKAKSIIRELSKVYGLPKEETDALLDNPQSNFVDNELTKQILHFGSYMTDFPNLRSIHAGGILISEKPIYHYTALDLPPKGFATTQWDMYTAEDLGFEKFDILSQRGIGHIKESIEIVKDNKNIDIDIHRVEDFKKDVLVKKQLKTGETNGCFYIESPAMRGLLKKLKCDDYLTLVAASSIIRPGVAKSGMMKEYIKRFHNRNEIKYLHPIMKEQLEETFGVMVYQEDVIKVCHHFAGLDLADADVLRRAMSGKHRGKEEFKRIESRFFENCKQKGYPDKLSKEVWRQIASFAGYSFSKAHSASYAVESFQSLYLKAHFPLEFMTAVINNFGGFYTSWVYFNEAKRWGANICLPCVNNSSIKTLIKGKDIYIGFIHVTNLEKSIGKRIQMEREQNGSFASLEDFISRIQIGRENLILLIRINAFRFTGQTKSELMWRAHSLISKQIKQPSTQKSLFAVETKTLNLPQLTFSPLENAYDEIEILGFPISMTYFELLQSQFRGEITACDLHNNIGRTVKMLGLLVTKKYVWTIKRELMHFGTFIDTKGEFFDTTHFPPNLKKYPFTGNGVYLILGKIVEEFGFPSVEVIKFARLPLKPDPRT